MQYAIFENSISSNTKIEITTDDYDIIKRSRDIILSSYNIESYFYCICAAHEELMQFLYSTSLSNSLFNNFDRHELNLNTINFSRKLSYILSNYKLYSDKAKSKAKYIDKNLSDTQLSFIFSKRYDSNIYYRAMEILRNYSQHAELPVHYATHGADWDDDREKLTYCVDLYSDTEKIIKSNKLSKVKAEEFRALGKLNLNKALKSYFSDICGIHNEIRELTKENTVSSYKSIREYQRLWKSETTNRKLVGVAAAAIVDSRPVQNSIIYLDESIYDAMEELKIRNKAPMNPHRIAITT